MGIELEKISIIIPTYRRELLLRNTLADVLRLDYDDLEIILVDQSESHDTDTCDLINNLGYKIRYFRTSPPNVVRAVNFGVMKSKGDILLFLDDDIAIPDKDLVEKLESIGFEWGRQ